MASVILFATTLVQTSQGWVEPGHPMAKDHMSSAEISDLLDEQKAVVCEYHSPLAAAIHSARRSGGARAEVERAIHAVAFGGLKLSSKGGEEPGGYDIEIGDDELTITEEPSSERSKTDPAPANHETEEESVTDTGSGAESASTESSSAETASKVENPGSQDSGSSMPMENGSKH